MQQISLELELKTWFTQKKIKNKLKFVNLTLAPIEKDLINFKLLKAKEKKIFKCISQESLSIFKFLS